MKRCNRDWENTNNRGGVVNEDVISELPEALIVQILSLLPTKVAVTTSVLSKQWNSFWKMMPQLKFDFCDHRGFRSFSDSVRKSLLSHKAPVLESLHLKIRINEYEAMHMELGILIQIAHASNVRKLVLDVKSEKGFARLPSSLYNCEILEALTLRAYVLVDVHPQVCLKSLKTLHLHSVVFDVDEETTFLNLLSGCPNLENLLMHPNNNCYVNTFTISVPSLQRLSLYNPNNKNYVINAPSLKYFKIEGIHGLGSGRMENVTKLVEASIGQSSPILDENLLRSLTSVKCLSLKLPFLKEKFPTGSIFYQLVYLELYATNKAWWDQLALMLHSSPKLQVLKIVDKQGRRKHVKACEKWKEPKNVPECLLFHLKTFVWKGFNQRLLEEEKEMVKYILRYANRLKKAQFTKGMSKDFESVAMASKSNELMLK